MERYNEYNPTNIEWLPQIPKHWHLETLRKFLRMVSIKNHPEKPLLSVTRENGVIIRDTESKEENHNFIPEDLSGYKYVEIGDFCINKMKSWQGSYGVSDYEGIVSPAYYICKLSGVDGKFFSKAIRSKCYVSFFAQYSKGIRIDQWDLSPISLKSIPFFLPPKEEQQAIVSYLDTKCSRIETLLSNKEKEISLLQEMKQRIIADAVTHGLNPNVKLKSTNIPWLPEIPEHWEIKPIRSLLREATDKSETGEEELLSLSQYTGISYKKEAKNVGMFEAESTVGYKKVKAGQFVMNIMLAWNGSYAVSSLDGIISPAYCVFAFISDCDKMYYHYLLRLGIYSGAFKTASRGIIDSRLRLYPNRFYPFPIICPPIEEQHAIVSYITERTSKINSLIEKLNKEIECIKEYKQRLISDVVTGQIKIS